MTQRLTERFTASGVLVSSGATRVGLRLRAVGYGGSLLPLAAVAPSARSNRVSYTYPGVTEWYANGPLGLEQGFTLTKPPPGRPAGPLTLSMVLTGDARALLSSGGQGITFSRVGAPSLHYSGLVSTDAQGRGLHSWLQLGGRGVLLRVDTHSARYPVRIDPFVQRKLTGGDESGEGEFGFSVAMSSDGNTALIGGPRDNSNLGGAWVFTRSGSTWTQQGAKLAGGEESGKGRFGYSVALSGDGNTALIGADGDNEHVGAAWVFTRSGSTWTQQGAKLTGGGESGRAWFGTSVALSSDGNTALIGGDVDGGGVGAAWVFTRSGTTWTQQGEKLTGQEESGEGHFGSSVALSSDGNTALIGGFRDHGNVGAAWAVTRSGTIWTQQGKKLTGAEETGEGTFGYSVALSGDGNTALIGGPENQVTGPGDAWVFTRSSATWSQQGGKLVGTGEVGEGEFGYGVALSGDGNTALIGGRSDNTGAGAAWVFTRSGSTWTQQGAKLAGGGESGKGQFGFSVALSSDGNTALIGGNTDNQHLESCGVEKCPSPGFGAAWVFRPCTATLQVEVTALPGGERGIPYRAELSACGGVPPYKWKKNGTLPKGLTLTSTGVIQGTPSVKKLAPGSYPISVKVIDSEKPKQSATATLTMTIK